MPVVKIEPSVAKFKVQKDKDVLLPDPFPLPKRVTPRVDAAVSSGEVDRLARNSLLSSVAHSIYQIKAYPSEADFINVSKEIMKNYPTFFLSQGALIELLKERMKQIRRPLILRTPKEKGSTSSKALKGGRSPGSIDSLKAPPVPLGEDEHSFERHNRVLKSQYSKSHPNQQIVTELMRITFAMRRADILNCPCDVKTIFEKYPFLQTEHLINDFTLLVGSSIHLEKDITIEDYFASSFSSFIPKIFSLAAIESKGRKLFNSVYHDLCQKDTSVESKLLIALYFLVYLLPDAQAKVNPSLLLLFSKGALDVEKVAADSRNKHPFIIILGSMNKPEQFFLIVDKVVVREVEGTSILINLLSAYYV